MTGARTGERASTSGTGLSSIVVNREAFDPEWDAFVATAPGGAYQQTSLWGHVKAAVGWGSARLVLRNERGIVGGCQVLLRKMPLLGCVAYISRGPVMTDRSEAALDALLAGLADLAAEQHILYLKLQPPADRTDLADALEARGFVESSLETAPTATVRIDLSGSPESLLSKMHPKTRKNIRKAQRLGVSIREGTAADLPTYGDLLEATSRRQNFTTYAREYYERMWHVFVSKGHGRLIMAEYDGLALSSQLLLAFGDSVVCKMGGWSGTHREVPPNELMHWSGIEWGRERGYRYYDLEGIEESIARALIEGGDLPASANNGATGFKLRLGGSPTIFPAAYDYVYRPRLNLALRRLAPRLDRLRPLANRVLGRGALSARPS